MKKKDILTVLFLFISIVVVIFILSTTISYKNKILTITIKKGVVLSVLSIMAVAVLFVISFFIVILKNSIHNIKNCDDEFWADIDNMKKNLKEDNNYYKKYIQKLNEYYQENGKIETLIKNQDIKRLYRRADFLAVQLIWYDDFIMYFVSLMISMVAGFMATTLNSDELISTVWIVILFVLFFSIALFKYKTRGRNGSYRYMLDEYERDLLIERIKELEKSLIIINENEKKEENNLENKLQEMLSVQQQLNEILQVELKKGQRRITEMSSEIKLLNKEFKKFKYKEVRKNRRIDIQ